MSTATLHDLERRLPHVVEGDGGARSARLIGALFIAGFLFYGTGSALVRSVIGEPDFIVHINEARTLFVFGVCLMLFNTFIDIGKGVLFYPVLARHGQRTALTYLAALVAQVVLMDVGAIFLLTLLPLGAQAADPAATGLASLLIEGSEYAYHTGQAVLCFGGFFLCLLLLRAALVPRPLAMLGIIGYALHATGSLAELFGLSISMVMLVPGGIFELALAFWLLARGFSSRASAVPA